jgi:threonine dehydrogenase-like Zn-dependent dehydrogenase
MGGLLEGDVVRLQRKLVVSNRHVFGIGAPGGPSMGDGGFAEYLVTLAKLCHALADGLDDAGHVRARDRVLGFEEPRPD